MDSEPRTCKAIVGQGPRKGQPCLSIHTLDADGYCTHHQRQKEYDRAIQAGKHLCRFFFRGCNEEVCPPRITCETCMNSLHSSKKTCTHTACKNHIEEGQIYCKKHHRNKYRDWEKSNNKTVCNIERGCFNVCEPGFVSCISCIVNNYIVNDRYFDVSIVETRCIMCEADYDATDNAIGHSIRHCKECLGHFLESNKSKKVVQRRVIYAEKSENALTHYREYVSGAVKRDRAFELSFEEFKSLVQRPCHYCNSVKQYSVMGIDRIDNNESYVLANCVPCCFTCNRMKHTLPLREFLCKCACIDRYLQKGSSISMDMFKDFPEFTSTSSVMTYDSYVKYVTKKRKIDITLTKEEYDEMKRMSCYICGMPSSVRHANGLDRVNNLVGYTLENTRPCCGHCNNMKADIPLGVFKEQIRRILRHNDVGIPDVDMKTDTIRADSRFTARDLLEMFDKSLDHVLQYCRVHNRSDTFVQKIRNLYDQKDVCESVLILKSIINMIHAENKKDSDMSNKKESVKQHKKAGDVVAMIMSGKLCEYLEWHAEHVGEPTDTFRTSLIQFIQESGGLTQEEKIERCQQELVREKWRRNNKKIREKVKQASVEPSPLSATATATAATEILPSPHTERPSMIIEEIAVERPVLLPDNVSTSSASSVSDNHPKQWKVKQIYEYIHDGREHIYKEYCEKNNTLAEDWDSVWDTFLTAVLACTSLEDGEPVIRDFVETLRVKRHNELCVRRNNILEREDRQVWPTKTIVQAFLSGLLEPFKEYCESYAGEDPADVQWQKRWLVFTGKLETMRSDESGLLDCVSKFLTNQRTRKYRASKARNVAAASKSGTNTL